jgi:hypothetical protein
MHELAPELLQCLEACRHGVKAAADATPLVLTLLARALPEFLAARRAGGLEEMLKPLMGLLEAHEPAAHVAEVLHVLALVATVQPEQALAGVLAALQLSRAEYAKVRCMCTAEIAILLSGKCLNFVVNPHRWGAPVGVGAGSACG